MATLYIPFLQNLFNTRPVPVEYYFYSMGFGLVILCCDEFRKFLIRRKDNKN